MFFGKKIFFSFLGSKPQYTGMNFISEDFCVLLKYILIPVFTRLLP